VSRINTIEEYHTARNALQPVYITSKTRGQIAVPCMHTMLVKTELVVANMYNPNEVPPDKLELLVTSIVDNGFCFPVVTIFDDDMGLFVVVDGAHRRMVLGAEWLDCDYIPLVVLPHDMSKRLAATWAFNKARGVHQVDLDAELIRRMLEQGLTEELVAEKLGIDLDTVHRYKQITGVAALFANQEYSRAWEMVDD
jgi:ParB-like chromosome segregation protein Spo0J